MILLGILFSCCIIFTIMLYLRYASKNITGFAAFNIILVWFITFSTAVIVPYDIYLSFENLHSSKSSNTLYNDSLHDDEKEHLYISNIINIFYVTMQMMSLVIIPMLLEYEMAGEFTFKDKLCTAIKRNLVLYGIAFVLFLLFLAYLIVQKSLTG